MGFEGADTVVADEAGDDVAGALEDLLVGQGDAVPGLEDTNAGGDVLQEQPNGTYFRGLLTPRAGRFASQDAGMLNESDARRKGLRDILVRRFVFSPMTADDCQ